MNTYEHVPHVSLHPSDFSVLKTVIQSHLAFLRKGVPPSKKRTQQIQTVQCLQQRLTIMINTHIENTCFPLTTDEIQALDEAIRCFITLIRQIVPASAERDGVLWAVEGLQQRVAVLLAPLSQ